ncbi:hypothetical protein EG68_03799 [Paragonimus skrjabini miyazakii]|uniref:Double-strand break repair protein n=1 Tax=Paragonimus skrjabini miyazakii TaxID=59628 RepID=A0A8S9Z619_9TREM|nr:hypothetical protein EG68_03799 [Paragonimus skrjabini miyazakii]
MSADDSCDTFRILISSDNHLGFAEKDGIRGPDSFRTFEEILSLAKTHDVDFIFFGGDIFHESRPSMQTTHEAIRLLREYCLGEKPVTFEMLSDSSVTFVNTAFPVANYLDKNINIGIPVFAIHGNHDDPSGPGGICAVDLLHSAGLVNLLGKTSSVERLFVSPLMLRKGSTQLALYALGAIREERAHRLFLNNMVTFYRPTTDNVDDDWFSLCAVHQNRSRHGPTNYLPEHFLPDFLDLVVWGHEHECRVEPEWNSSQNFYVMQPGSSVATTLSEGEAREKAVALLDVRGKHFKVTRIPLQTVRPFLFRDVVLEDELPNFASNPLDMAKQVELTCERLVEQCLADVAQKKSSSNFTKCGASPPSKRMKSSTSTDVNTSEDNVTSELSRWEPPAEPLIRLRVDLSGGYESFSALRFGQRFVGRVANPKDLVMFNHSRERLAAAQTKRALHSGLSEIPVDFDGEVDRKKVGLDVVEVEKLVRQYLSNLDNSGKYAGSDNPCNDEIDRLDLFTANELGRSLRQFVDKDARDAIQSVVESVLTETVQHLRVRRCPEAHIVPDIVSFCHSRVISSTDPEKEQVNEISEVTDHTKTQDDSNSFHSRTTVVARTTTTVPVDEIVEWSSDEDQSTTSLLKPTTRTSKPSFASSKSQRSRTIIPKVENPFPGLDEADEDTQVWSIIEDDDSPPRAPSVASSRIRHSRYDSALSVQSHHQSERGSSRGRGKPRGTRDRAGTRSKLA